MNKPRLKFIIVSEEKDFFGLWEICIQINYVEYTYTLNSSYAIEQIKKHLRKNRYGAALNLLKEWCMFDPKKKELPRPTEVEVQDRTLRKTKNHLIKAIREVGKPLVESSEKLDFVEVELTKALDLIQNSKGKEN